LDGFLLDTNTIRYWFDSDAGRFPAVKSAAEERQADSPLYVSAITLGEIEYGHALNPAGGGRREDYVAFARKQLPQVLNVSKHTAEPYGRIRATLAKKFPPPGGWRNGRKRKMEELYDPTHARELGIDENDLWMVAQAVERNLVMVTSDKMKRVRDAVRDVYPGFRIEDWKQFSE
jgi:predicted nucleic acid-binding protein